MVGGAAERRRMAACVRGAEVLLDLCPGAGDCVLQFLVRRPPSPPFPSQPVPCACFYVALLVVKT